MRRPRLTMPIMDEDFEGIKLTPEQERIREELYQKQQEQWDLQEKENSEREAQRHINTFNLIADGIAKHPLLRDLIATKSNPDPKTRYMQIALPAVIQAHPEWGVQEIADFTYMLSKKMVED